MLLNSPQFKFLKNYRNVNVKSSAKRDYRDENVFLKGDRAISKLITLLISKKKEFNHFFKNGNSYIVLLKLGNLHQNAKLYEARLRRAHSCELRAKIFYYFIHELVTKLSYYFSVTSNFNFSYFEIALCFLYIF